MECYLEIGLSQNNPAVPFITDWNKVMAERIRAGSNLKPIVGRATVAVRSTIETDNLPRSLRDGFVIDLTKRLLKMTGQPTEAVCSIQVLLEGVEIFEKGEAGGAYCVAGPSQSVLCLKTPDNAGLRCTYTSLLPQSWPHGLESPLMLFEQMARSLVYTGLMYRRIQLALEDLEKAYTPGGTYHLASACSELRRSYGHLRNALMVAFEMYVQNIEHLPISLPSLTEEPA